MAYDSKDKTNNSTMELATFYLGSALCGMDILNIQEINKLTDITKVPQAPEYVMGILNLRGQIVTIIDLGRKLGLPMVDRDEKNRNIIVRSKDESIGLFVSRISDVVTANPDKIEPPPANIGNIQGEYFGGVFKTEDRLVGVLNLEKIVSADR